MKKGVVITAKYYSEVELDEKRKVTVGGEDVYSSSCRALA